MAPDTLISDFLSFKTPVRSVEFFPPKDEAGQKALMNAADSVRALGLDFVSVTYGAGGSTRAATVEACKQLRWEYKFTVMPHLTCVASAEDELMGIVEGYRQEGIRNIMALGGDVPQGMTEQDAYRGGLRYGSDLVSLIRKRYDDICIGVAGYPETHPRASSPERDMKNLKFKMDQGADFITTQLFFDNSDYYRFVDKCRNAGIQAPIIAGLMPVLSARQVRRITELCRATLPAALASKLEMAGDCASDVEAIGVEWAFDQANDLLANGVPGIHLYILNRSKACLQLARRLRQAAG
jgi:methylenetetrahydrofolate reductase (NADPH)